MINYFSIIQQNLLTVPHYSPYCGSADCKTVPRTVFDGEQFKCPLCGWRSRFEPEFIADYKKRWEDKSKVLVKSGDPCSHKGCLHHVLTPCEGCGRIAGVGDIIE